MPSQKYFCPDPQDPTWTMVYYTNALTPAQLNARKLRRLRNYAQIQEKLSDPMETYFYYKEQNEISAAKRAAKVPRNYGKTMRELIHEIQLRSTNDRMPIIIHGNNTGTKKDGQVVNRKVVKNTRNRTSNQFQKQIENNADNGLLNKVLFEMDFIKSVIRMRQKRGLSQSDLAKLMNIKELELRAFERNELLYDASLKILLTTQLNENV